MRLLLATLFISFVSHSVHAGVWGDGSFENDVAIDWVQDVRQSSNIDPLLTSFSDVLISQYLDVDLCSQAVASAEVIASFKTEDFQTLPEGLVTWASQHKGSYEPEMSKLALKALKECQNIDKSELAQLWADSNVHGWQVSLKTLEKKLQ